VIPSRLDGLRRKERLRELFSEIAVADLNDLGKLAAALAPLAGLDDGTALAHLTEFAAMRSGVASCNQKIDLI
jgi:hypothetical protein